MHARALRVLTEPQFAGGEVGLRLGTSARLRVDHLSPQWAASAPSLKPPLLLEVLGGGKDPIAESLRDWLAALPVAAIWLTFVPVGLPQLCRLPIDDRSRP
ncbi:hypothetical protein NDU88_007193 [Pleurodeles waltl]|uniref:Uncharacterized protein n=1 Tax=Pleurodeles waltl TaxID=8319 RepID=A0AAV7RPK5_PLEWA|nr:hypothetical protein NDU88_007193 [Pleurodeles waltl]